MHQHFSYPHGVPTAHQFQKDSSVSMTLRANDRILLHLDWALERFHVHNAKRDPEGWAMGHVVLADLFLASNYWIKAFHEKHPYLLPERYPAVAALFEAVVNELARRLKCSRPRVAYTIEEIFGRDLSTDGMKTDARKNPIYYSKAYLQLLRLRFRGGLAYHYGADALPGAQLHPLNSADFYSGVARRGDDGKLHAPGEGWGPFIMTLDREFYMSRHVLDDPSGAPNVFHSSYTHGATVAAAGTMLVTNGMVVGIRPDSGHYRPLAQHIAGALLALQMVSVKMDRLFVYDFTGVSLGTAREFMSSNMSWARFMDARRDLIAQRELRARVGGNVPAAGNPSAGNPSGGNPYYNTSQGYGNNPAYNS